ncbi:hypothetical protein B0H21DRAFT_826713 [Amylocystis lapponica]|nr:hypothetical protein B0H21DRAFT_826713 [Amylocystis lapponica]
MPEADVLCALKQLVVKAQNAHARRYKEPLRGHLQLFPRTFATGTATKSWTTCTAHRRGYEDTLEPIPDTFQPNKFDAARSKKQSWEYLIKPLCDGEVVVQIFTLIPVSGCSQHGMRLNLGLEASLLTMKRQDLEEILSQDVPGPNKSKAKAQKLRSFLVTNRFIVPRSQKTAKDRTLNIFAAVICEHVAFALIDFARLVTVEIISLSRHWEQSDVQPGSELWSSLWSDNHGPDWIYETEMAMQGLLQWRQQIIDNPNGSTANAPIVKVLCDSQDIFNGFGRHTAHDFLHLQGLWPGHPTVLICQANDIFDRFRDGLVLYMSTWASQKFLERVAGVPNVDNPLQFNYKSDINYMSHYVHVYRKSFVRVPAELYNELLRTGMLDRHHVIGEPYSEEHLQASGLSFVPDGQRKECMVVVYRQEKFKIYTIIRAMPPSDWRFQSEDLPVQACRGRTDSVYATTLGPGQFRQQVQNQLNPSLAGKPGRRKKLPPLDLAAQRNRKRLPKYEH